MIFTDLFFFIFQNVYETQSELKFSMHLSKTQRFPTFIDDFIQKVHTSQWILTKHQLSTTKTYEKLNKSYAWLGMQNASKN